MTADPLDARLRLGQPRQGGRDRGAAGRRRRAAAAARRRSPTSSRTPTRWSATPGSRPSRSSRRSDCRPSPTTPGSRSTRSTARLASTPGGTPGPDCTYADNRHKLLGALAGIDDRRARFRTVAMVVWPDGRELAVEGVCEGSISVDERGSGGWGYDSLFVPADGDGRTFAEMTDDDKHAMSSRGRRSAPSSRRSTAP